LVRWCVGAASRFLVAIQRAEIVPKFGTGAAYPQVAAWAPTFCKSVGVCLRRFESCTCHTAKRASDLGVCPSEALRRCPALSGRNRLFADVRKEYGRKFDRSASRGPVMDRHRHRPRWPHVFPPTRPLHSAHKDAGHRRIACRGI
jgi:hypothetical protein